MSEPYICTVWPTYRDRTRPLPTWPVLMECEAANWREARQRIMANLPDDWMPMFGDGPVYCCPKREFIGHGAFNAYWSQGVRWLGSSSIRK